MIDRLVHHAEVIALKGDSYPHQRPDLGRVPYRHGRRPMAPSWSIFRLPTPDQFSVAVDIVPKTRTHIRCELTANRESLRMMEVAGTNPSRKALVDRHWLGSTAMGDMASTARTHRLGARGQGQPVSAVAQRELRAENRRSRLSARSAPCSPSQRELSGHCRLTTWGRGRPAKAARRGQLMSGYASSSRSPVAVTGSCGIAAVAAASA